jgi:hypothetical protein
MRHLTRLLSAASLSGLIILACGSEEPPLALSLEVFGSGHVASTPDGFDCNGPRDCGTSRWDRDSVSLAGTPATGEILAGWVLLKEKNGEIVEVTESSSPLTVTRRYNGSHVVAVFGKNGSALQPWRVGSDSGGGAGGVPSGSGGSAGTPSGGNGGASGQGTAGTAGAGAAGGTIANLGADCTGMPRRSVCSKGEWCLSGRCLPARVDVPGATLCEAETCACDEEVVVCPAGQGCCSSPGTTECVSEPEECAGQFSACGSNDSCQPGYVCCTVEAPQLRRDCIAVSSAPAQCTNYWECTGPAECPADQGRFCAEGQCVKNECSADEPCSNFRPCCQQAPGINTCGGVYCPKPVCKTVADCPRDQVYVCVDGLCIGGE